MPDDHPLWVGLVRWVLLARSPSYPLYLATSPLSATERGRFRAGCKNDAGLTYLVPSPNLPSSRSPYLFSSLRLKYVIL
jgi:hypothetical protein